MGGGFSTAAAGCKVRAVSTQEEVARSGGGRRTDVHVGCLVAHALGQPPDRLERGAVVHSLRVWFLRAEPLVAHEDRRVLRDEFARGVEGVEAREHAAVARLPHVRAGLTGGARACSRYVIVSGGSPPRGE